MLKTIKAGLAILALYLCPTTLVSAGEWDPKLTEFQQPDMQGVWFYGTATPFERPEALGDKRSYSAAEAKLLMQSLQEAEKLKSDPLTQKPAAPEAGAMIAQEADHNFADARTSLIPIQGQYRTSQIVSPNNGRLPFVEGAKDIFQKWEQAGHGAFDGPEIRPVSERCVGPNAGPMAPMISWFYNANMQIIQTQDYFILVAEMNNDARIIPIKPKVNTFDHSRWMGNSRGRWEGNTLVVETSDFRPEQSWFAFYMSDQLGVTERFTLVGNDELFYSYTLTDPGMYETPVTVEKIITRRAPGEHLFEYACHEGNYSLPGILAGARRLESED